jgi:hypothetical protein
VNRGAGQAGARSACAAAPASGRLVRPLLVTHLYELRGWVTERVKSHTVCGPGTHSVPVGGMALSPSAT